MTRKHCSLLRWMVIALLAVAPAALAQQAPPRSPTQPQRVAEQADDYPTQLRQTVRFMDQDLSRVLSGTGDPHSKPKRSSQNVTQVQRAHRAYLDQRTMVLAMVREAERPDPIRDITQEQIDAAREELERLYRQVLATAK